MSMSHETITAGLQQNQPMVAVVMVIGVLHDMRTVNAKWVQGQKNPLSKTPRVFFAASSFAARLRQGPFQRIMLR